MALKAKKKPAAKREAAKLAPRKRATAPVASEHRVAVSGVALAVSYGRDRTERMELRGTATLNVNASNGGSARTTGFVALALKKGAKIANRVAYAPASLNRNLVFTLYVDEGDLALFRDLFVTGTGSEASDPSLVFWARTMKALEAGEATTEPVTEFGFRLDFAPAPAGAR
jgi:hypothetical protein